MIINIGIHLISLMGVELKTCISSLVYSNERSMLRHSDFFFKIDFTYTPKLNKRVPFDKEIVLANKKIRKLINAALCFFRCSSLFYSYIFQIAFFVHFKPYSKDTQTMETGDERKSLESPFPTSLLRNQTVYQVEYNKLVC